MDTENRNRDHKTPNPNTIVTQDGTSQIELETFAAQGTTDLMAEVLKLLWTQFNSLNTKTDLQNTH